MVFPSIDGIRCWRNFVKKTFSFYGFLLSLSLLLSSTGRGDEFVTATPDDVDMSNERMERVDTMMQKWIDQKLLVGAVGTVARMGHVVHCKAVGLRDIEANQPMSRDTLFRIFSMTKPITATAILLLYEEGYFHLNDPISNYIPEFKNMRVYDSGSEDEYVVVNMEREITIHDLLTHTSGLTYGGERHPVEKMYRKAALFREDQPLKELVIRLTQFPLMFQPGTAWEYSYSYDVLGYLIELLSGQSLDTFFKERIFKPLRMKDTGFIVSKEKRSRFAQTYQRQENGGFVLLNPSQKYDENLRCFSGGEGLVSSAEDYMNFLMMLINDGEFEGLRFLNRKSVELMTINHVPIAYLPDGPNGRKGYGFGLGMAVMTDLAKADILGSEGEYNWGSVASTSFWIDPKEELVGLFLTQLMNNSRFPEDFRVLVYQAIAD